MPKLPNPPRRVRLPTEHEIEIGRIRTEARASRQREQHEADIEREQAGWARAAREDEDAALAERLASQQEHAARSGRDSLSKMAGSVSVWLDRVPQDEQ